jgi:hypothetical protein
MTSSKGDSHGVQNFGQLGEFQVESVQVPRIGFSSCWFPEHMRLGRHVLPISQQWTSVPGDLEIREVHG